MQARQHRGESALSTFKQRQLGARSPQPAPAMQMHKRWHVQPCSPLQPAASPQQAALAACALTEHGPAGVDHLQLAVAGEGLGVGGQTRGVPAVVTGVLALQVGGGVAGEGAQELDCRGAGSMAEGGNQQASETGEGLLRLIARLPDPAWTCAGTARCSPRSGP